MFYVYVSRSGKRVELQFPIGKAPDKTKYDNDVYFRDTLAEIASQQFVLKGSGWPSQDTRRKEQMTRNNVEAGNRTHKTWGKPKKCLPNHKGKLTDSWEDVKKLVKKEG
jgi:hypothetical protein